MSPRRSYREQSRKHILSLWQREEEFGEPIGCVATTFTFDAAFFEEEALGRFVGMDTDASEDGWAYIVEREEKFSQVFSCALVDRRNAAQQRSLRWHLIPVHVPKEGIFHPKLAILAWQHRLRVLIGSANLTEAGYRKNFEHVAVLDFTSEGGMPKALLGDVLRFLRGLRHLCPGAETADGPFGKLEAFIVRVKAQVRNWPDADWGRSQPYATFVPLVPGRASVLDQLDEEWGRPGPTEVWTLSPYFSDGERAVAVLERLAKSMAVHGGSTIHILSRGYRQADGNVVLDVPEAMREPAVRRCSHRFYLVSSRDDEGEERELHAKSLWLQRGPRCAHVVGSSNFTGPGLGVGVGTVNVEANLAYWLPAAEGRFYRMCTEAYPDHEKVDPAEVEFIAESGEDSGELDADAPLPAAFEAAIFRLDSGHAVLELHIGADAPPIFAIHADQPDGKGPHELLLDRTTWDAKDERPVRVPWSGSSTPSLLRVDWSDGGEEPRTSRWVVNIANTSDLPEPEEIQALSLDQLVQILSSARPLHEAIRRIKRRADGVSVPNGGGVPVEADPHKKMELRSRDFLLRRVRRVSSALEGLRHRLECPVATLDALKWRLHGPVGPVALARRLAEQEGDGAAFMITEVALTLHRVDWKTVARFVGNEQVQTLVATTYDDLRKLAQEHAPPKGIARYVEAGFGRVEQ